MKPVRNKKILLIEDNAQNAYLATYLLQSRGFEVVVVGNGKEALRQVKDINPALIVTDIQLPEMDGYEFGRRLKENPEFESILLVAATSYAMAGDREKALRIGFDAYIEKPFKPETFVDEIEFYLKKETRRGANESVNCRG